MGKILKLCPRQGMPTKVLIASGTTDGRSRSIEPESHDSVVDQEKLRQSRHRAVLLLYQAACLLSSIGEEEQRMGWLIEDCADIMLRKERAIKSGDVDTQPSLEFTSK